MNYDAEYRREDAAGGIGVSRTALDLGRGERAKHVPRSRSDVARRARPGGTSVLRLSVFQGSAPRGCDPPKGSTPTAPGWTGRGCPIARRSRTSRQDGVIRQQLIEQLTREIMNYDAEYRREDAAGGIGVSCAALDLGRGERAKHVPRSRSDVARQARPGGTSVLRLSVFQGSAPRGCDPPKGSTPPPGWTGR